MPSVVSGHVTAFFLFDVAEGVDLAAVRARLGSAGQSARLAPRPAIPPYVKYQEPPVQVEADALGATAIEGWQGRFKVFDYGVVSLSLSRPFQGSTRGPRPVVATPSSSCGARCTSRARRTCRKTTSSMR